MTNYVIYCGGLIAKSSEAYKLWKAKDWAKLDRHLAKRKKEAQQGRKIL